MMSSTLGAPFGGTMRGAHQAFDCRALSLITPPNFGGGAGSCLPSMVIVALGEPSVPLTCWAFAADQGVEPRTMLNDSALTILIIPLLLRKQYLAAPPLLSQEAGQRRYAS